MKYVYIFLVSLLSNFAVSQLEVNENYETAIKMYNEGLSLINGTQRKYSSAIELFSKAASFGHLGAKKQIALAYLFGEYLPFNFTMAHDLLKDISDAEGDPSAQFYLGFMHANGLGVNSSQYKALVFYTLSASSGDAYGRMTLAYRQSKLVNLAGGSDAALPLYSSVADDVASEIKMGSGPIVHRVRLADESEGTSLKSGILVDEEVVQYYQLLAERGDVQAQLGLGELFYSGKRGLMPNFKRALYYFNKAADTGSDSAISYMGKIYAQGDEFVPQNTGKALRLLRHASEKGDAIGQSGLALMYYHGIGVTKNFETARKYFLLAADKKNIESFLWLAIMYYNGEGVNKNLKTAVEYFTLAAQGGHILGPYYLATINAYGPGIIRQTETSADLFKTVAERGKWSMIFMDAHQDFKTKRYNQAFMKYLFLAELGYEDGQVNAAYLLDHGKVSLFSDADRIKRIFTLYFRAANQGNAYSRVRLGDFYYYGMGEVQSDMQAAVTQYKAAADGHEDAQAMFNIGYMYEKGLGLKQDLYLAKRYYDKAHMANADAYLPTSLALLKLKFYFLQYKITHYFSFKRPVIFIKEMQALRFGTVISGLVILILFCWMRPF